MSVEQGGPLPPNKSSFGCLKMLAVAAGIIAVTLIVIGVLVWQMISWLKNAPEPNVATYALLQLSPGELVDVSRIVTEIYTAARTGEDIDERITPQVFNGVVEKLIEDDKKQNKTNANGSVFFRTSLTGNGIEVKTSFPINGDKNTSASTGTPAYINAEAAFRLEIENGVVTQAEIQGLSLHDQPAPFLVRAIFYRNFSEWLKQARQPNQNIKNKPDLEIFKTMKVEGQRLHIVLDGKKVKEADERKRATQEKELPVDSSKNQEPMDKEK